MCQAKAPKRKRCQERGWSLVLDDIDPAKAEYHFKKATENLKDGVYKGFAVAHTKAGKTHLHIGIILGKVPKTLYWKNKNLYFGAQTNSEILKNKSKDFNKKLQTYYDYCMNQELHEGETIHKPPYLYRWKPKTAAEMQQSDPKQFLADLIFANLTQDNLDENIDESTEWSLKTRQYALQQYEKLCKQIETLEDIRERKRLREEYKEDIKEYRPFQKGIMKVLDTQDDRNIHCHFDGGQTGKNKFVSTERKRPDTLILQSAETKRIAYAWNPKKHKRIIFDIPKHKMEFVNTSVIEKLKNGTLFSEMHKPLTKISNFNPTILILGNEPIDPAKWTDDRATYSTTNAESGFEYGELSREHMINKHFPEDKTTESDDKEQFAFRD